MPHNKKHHYVPKFYLRNFSPDGRSIGIHNIPSKHTVLFGNLSNQCYRNYFYGKQPSIEHALSGIEGAAAQVIRNLLQGQKPPASLSNEHIVLSHFIVLQAARTEYEAEAEAEATDKVFKTVYREELRDLKNYRIGFDDPVLMSLHAASRVVPAVYDLRAKLLFVFLPLSPKLLYLFYDAETYRVGGKTESIVPIDCLEDVENLNALQWLSALKNVYFAPGYAPTMLTKAAKIVSRRRSDKSSVSEHPLASKRSSDDPPDTTRSLLHEFRPSLEIRLKVKCIRLRRHPKHPRYDNRAAPVRDVGYLKIVDEFAMLLAQKKVRPENFLAFAAQHAAMRN